MPTEANTGLRRSVGLWVKGQIDRLSGKHSFHGRYFRFRFSCLELDFS